MANYLNFPYDEEIFNYAWKNEPDVFLTNMIESGAVVYDGELERLIGTGSNFYTLPYYDVLGGDPVLYDGDTDITTTSTTGGQLAGAVYGRAKGWNVKSFIKDFNSGADPMQQVVQGVAKYWAKQRQAILIKTLEGIFGVADFASHIDVVSNNLSATSLNDSIVKACGDNADGFSLVIMHSTVANNLANLQLLEYSKYTDKSGITRNLPLATVNGMRVIINDNVGTNTIDAEYEITEDAELNTEKTYYTYNSGTKVYTAVAEPDVSDIATYYELITPSYVTYNSYVLGQGAIRFATAPVDVPSELDRDPAKAGGTDFLYTRIRETMLPYGFSFKSNALTNNVGIADSSISNGSNWVLEFPHEAVKIVKIVSKG